jgi:flagellar basal-body rod protein FlgB
MAIMTLIEKALNIRAFYQHIISGNIANLDTPNYKEKDIDFRRELERKMSTHGDIEVREKRDASAAGGADGNTVDIESQIVKMTENNLMFNALVQIATKKFSMMRYMINEGRR